MTNLCINDVVVDDYLIHDERVRNSNHNRTIGPCKSGARKDCLHVIVAPSRPVKVERMSNSINNNNNQ